jgi:NitT/TauT family transport system substrate-binding protein
MGEWMIWLRRVGLLLLICGLVSFPAWIPPSPVAASAGATPPATPQLATVHFGSPQAISDAGVFIAAARGYFAAQGLDVDSQPFQSGPNTIVPLASGDLDVAGGTFSIALLNAIDRGVRIRVVADKGTSRPGFEFSQVLLRRGLLDSGQVHDVADLRGRRVAVASLRSGAEAIAHQVLAQGGVGIDEVTLTPLGYPDMLVAFANDAIDAGVVIEPILSAAVGRGVASTWEPGRTSTAYGGPYQAGLLLFSDQFASQTDLARRFMVAYLRGVRDYNDAFVKGEGRDDVVRVLTEATAVKDPGLYEQMHMAGLNPDGRVGRRSMQTELSYFHERGYYSGNLTLDDVIDPSFAEYAAQQLGPYR